MKGNYNYSYYITIQVQYFITLLLFVDLQQQYNLLARESEWEVFEVCRNEGVGVLSWSPLKRYRYCVHNLMCKTLKYM